MFLNRAGKVLDKPFANENLSLTLLNEFLKVMGNSLRSTEVFHVLRNFDAHFFANPEKVVNTVFAGHDHSLKVIRTDPVFPEFLFSNRLNVVEGPPVNLDAVFFFDVVVRRSFWFGLRDQYGLYGAFWGCNWTCFYTVCTHSVVFNGPVTTRNTSKRPIRVKFRPRKDIQKREKDCW